MKKSTILLASLTAAGPLAAFIFPASLMLLCSTDASVPVNATPQTFALPPFRHLVIERNDTADIYLPLDFNIEASDSTDTPTLTTAQDWGKWLTLATSGDTLRMTIAVPYVPEGYNSAYCPINGLLHIPKPQTLESVTNLRCCDKMHISGINTPALSLHDTPSVDFRDSEIGTLTTYTDYYSSDIELDATRITALTWDLSDNSSNTISCKNDALVDTMTIISDNPNPRDLDIRAARIGTIIVNPDSTNGPVTIYSIRSAIIRE